MFLFVLLHRLTATSSFFIFIATWKGIIRYVERPIFVAAHHFTSTYNRMTI